ncbi:hemicentin-1-like, partial [Stylophora pistillata]|uniref:hemicentin-1-like n=1 Tax=Stylophora pistillata TaxID=50429 RepID=UPI000C03C0DC
MFCGDHKTAVVRSRGRYIWLRFFPARRFGFRAYYRARSFNQTATLTMKEVPKTQSILLNRTSSLWCPVEGAPAPYIMWRKNGVVVQNSTSIKYQLLETAENNANYSCEVRRGEKISWREISLNVEKCPGPCECSILKGTNNKLLRVNCEGKELMSFPWKIPLATAGLDLSNNKLNYFSSDVFRSNTHLRLLELNNNQLKNLPSGIFSNNTQLRGL